MLHTKIFNVNSLENKPVAFVLSANDYGGITKYTLNIIKELELMNIPCTLHIPYFAHFYFTKKIRSKRNFSDLWMWARYLLGQIRLEVKVRRFKFAGSKLGIVNLKVQRYFFSPSARKLASSKVIIIQQSGLLQQMIDLRMDVNKIIVVIHHLFTNNPRELENNKNLINPKLVAISNYTFKACSDLGITNHRLIFSGVDSKMFTPLKRSRIEDGKIHIGFYHHTHVRKNPELTKYLINHFQPQENIFIHVFGIGYSNKNPTKNLKVHKYLTELEFSIELSNLDLFVFNSKMEGFGLPPLEAMASGVSVISSKVGAVPEFLNNSNGILLDPETNKDIWVDSINELVASYDLRRKFSLNGRKAAEDYSWRNTAEKYSALFAEID